MALRTSEMKRWGGILVFCVLCLLGAAMCSGPKGAVKTDAQRDATAGVRVPALSPEESRKAEESLAIVAQGDTDASARALVALVPDGMALLQHHDALLRVAENAQGEMNLPILREACPQYHRRHAKSEITDATRSVAIFQWMGQKVWETPKGPDKEAAARAFIADVDRSIDAGRLKVGPGLRLAYHTIMMPLYVRPGVSVVPLVNLFKKHVAPEKPYMLTTLLEIGDFADPNDVDRKELRDFLRSYYPDRLAPESSFVNIPSYVAQPVPLKWEEYEGISTQSFQSISNQFTTCYCGDIRWRYWYCKAATQHLVDEFDAKPEEIKAFLAKLLAEKRLSPTILGGVMGPLSTSTDWEGRQPIAPDPDYVERKAGLFDLLLGHLERRVQAKERQGVIDAMRVTKICLMFLGRIPLNERTETIRQFEKRSVELLLTTGPIWDGLRHIPAPSRYNGGEFTYDGELPYRALVDRELNLSPETKQFLRERIRQLKLEALFPQDFLDEE